VSLQRLLSPPARVDFLVAEHPNPIAVSPPNYVWAFFNGSG